MLFRSVPGTRYCALPGHDQPQPNPPSPPSAGDADADADAEAEAEALVARMGLEGVIQIASFHPQYRFEGTGADDIGNATNRSPYPMLHLLREDSIARAVDAYGDTSAISAANIATLEKLGAAGLRALMRPRDPA